MATKLREYRRIPVSWEENHQLPDTVRNGYIDGQLIVSPIETRDEFRDLVRRRTGVEKRIATLKRQHGWNRSRLTGIEGARIWCGHGVLTHNLTKLARLATPRTIARPPPIPQNPGTHPPSLAAHVDHPPSITSSGASS